MQPGNPKPYTEEHLLDEIRRVASEAPHYQRAVRGIADLLKRTAGGVIFLYERSLKANPLARPEIRDFLSSPHRSKFLYTIPITSHGSPVGRLIAAFAEPPFDADAPQRIARFAARQIESLLHHSRAARLTA